MLPSTVLERVWLDDAELRVSMTVYIIPHVNHRRDPERCQCSFLLIYTHFYCFLY